MNDVTRNGYDTLQQCLLAEESESRVISLSEMNGVTTLGAVMFSASMAHHTIEHDDVASEKLQELRTMIPIGYGKDDW